MSTPRIQINSDIKDDELRFTISNINVSFVNALRRIILSEIPLVIFRVSPHNESKCVVMSNDTTNLSVEILTHRLSLVPIYIKNTDEFPIKNYIMTLNVENNTDTYMEVTTKDFVIKEISTGNPIDEEKNREIFPANDLTGDFILFAVLRPKPAQEFKPKTIKLTCEFDIGMAKENAAYNAASTCTHIRTIDEGRQNAKLQQMRQKWKDEGKTADEIEFESENWKLLEGKRIFLEDTFDFRLQTACVYSNVELLILACKIMVNKLEKIDTLIEQDNLEIKLAESKMSNSFDIVLDGEDYSLGNVLEYMLQQKYYFNSKIMSSCSFSMNHPHDNYGVIRVAYFEPVEKLFIKGNLKEAATDCVNIFNTIKNEFIRLVK
jgi:DNA-directed RNA polymerase subunit L